MKFGLKLSKKQQKHYHHSRSISQVYSAENYPKQHDAFIRLRDNVLFYSLDGKTKVILIESSISFEAKTTCAINLGVILGEANKKVLIFDLDLKKPKLHRTFNIENKNGLVDFMLGNCKKEDLVKHTEFPNVDIVNRGENSNDASVIFQSQKFADLMAEFKSEYDYVILDSSPVLLTSDYLYISKISDAILFTCAYAGTKKQQANEAISLIKETGTPIMGAVFTFYDSKRSGDYNDYYYYNYYHYDSYEQKVDESEQEE